MIVTDHFVLIHTSRHAGSFLNRMVMQCVSGAKKIRYHGHLSDLPSEYHHLPVIGMVRNPWDWYVSMYHNYRQKRQHLFMAATDNDTVNFNEAVTRFLILGDKSEASNMRLDLMGDAATVASMNSNRPRLESSHFQAFSEDIGYYTWLRDTMYANDYNPTVHMGRFEDLRTEMFRLFDLTGTPVTDKITRYLNYKSARNTSDHTHYHDYYSDELAELVREKDNGIINDYGYTYE